MKIWGWVIVAGIACVVLLGGAYLVEGLKFFRNIDQAEALLYVGWAAVGVIGVIVPVLVKAFRDDRQPPRAHDRR